MTPPGYKTEVGGGAQATTECPDREYRPDWKPSSEAGACLPCGDGVSSEPTDYIMENGLKKDVRGSAGSCYIEAGQGMVYSPVTNRYKAVNCDNNNYGVTAKTGGLAARPCTPCPTGLRTFDDVSKATNGFTSPAACRTKKGFGYNGKIGIKCPQGSYNDEKNLEPCKKCDPDYSTVQSGANGVGQAELDDCKPKAGYGLNANGVVQACPIGTYRAFSPTSTSCTSCTDNLLTSTVGGESAADCNVCRPGFGTTVAAPSVCSACGGASASYGPTDREVASACVACANPTTPYSFIVQAGLDDVWAPSAVARAEAESAADCLAQFAQLGDNGAWSLAGAQVPVTMADTASFAKCADACADECMFVTYNYNGDTCNKKVASGTGDNVVAFKALLATPDVSQAQAGRRLLDNGTVTAKALRSGSYTMWRDSGSGIGQAGTNLVSQANPMSVNACLENCDAVESCAAVIMGPVRKNTDVTAIGLTTCQLISGDEAPATKLRSITRAVPNRLTLAADAVNLPV